MPPKVDKNEKRPSGLGPSGLAADAAAESEIKSALTLPLAGVLYERYSVAVGGKAFNGDPLPTWDVFKADPAKQLQADAWGAVASAAQEKLYIPSCAKCRDAGVLPSAPGSKLQACDCPTGRSIEGLVHTGEEHAGCEGRLAEALSSGKDELAEYVAEIAEQLGLEKGTSAEDVLDGICQMRDYATRIIGGENARKRLTQGQPAAIMFPGDQRIALNTIKGWHKGEFQITFLGNEPMTCWVAPKTVNGKTLKDEERVELRDKVLAALDRAFGLVNPAVVD